MSDKNILIADKFFSENPENILGDVEQYINQYGEQAIRVKGGERNLEKITAPVIEKTFKEIPESNFTDEMPSRSDSLNQRIDKVIQNEKNKVIEKEVGTVLDPEKYGKDVYTFKEIVDIYNPHITNAELQAWLFTNPQLPAEKYLGKKGITLTQEELIEQGLICYMSGKFYYKYIYESGRIDTKISKLKQEKSHIIDVFGEKQYNYQADLLQKAMPKKKHITPDKENSISILAFSETSKTFQIDGINSVIFESGKKTLFEAFAYWLDKVIDKSEIQNITYTDLKLFFIQNKQYSVKSTDSKEIQAKVKKKNIDLKQRADREGERLFDKFLNDELTTDDKSRLEIVWNNKFNNYKHVNLDKIPVGFTFSKYFKNKSSLKLSKTQRDGVAFIAVIKSGILAYDVGVGKTLSSIAVLSYLFENGYSDFPLITVPNNVYKKWILEVFGGTDEITGQKIYGALPHFKFRPLFNMNNNIIVGGEGYKGLKEYSDEEKKKINNIIKEELKLKEILSKARKQSLEYFEIDSYFTNNDKFSGYIPAIKEDANNLFYEERDLVKFKNKDADLSLIGIPAKSKESKKYINRAVYVYESLQKIIKEEYKYLIFNLGKFKPVEKGTISIITKEGLRNIGLEYSEDIVGYMFEVLSQGDAYGGGMEQSKQTEREAAKLYEKIEAQISSKIGGNKLPIEELNIDALVYDEAHYAKKIFTSLKGTPAGDFKTDENGTIIFDTNGNPIVEKEYDEKGRLKRDKARYKIDKGQPSGDGLTAYAISRYVQQKTDGRNVILLTATPFENSPLEVYSMLSLANHGELVSRGYGSMRNFFDTFMRIEFDIRITATNQVVKDTILAGFRNLPQFRSVVRSIIHYKTGEEANVIRPDKITLPNFEKNIKTSFRMNEIQEWLMFLIEAYVMEEINIKELVEKSPSFIYKESEDFYKEKGIIKEDEDNEEDINSNISKFTESDLYSIVFNLFSIFIKKIRDLKENSLSGAEKEKYIGKINKLKQPKYNEKILTDDEDTSSGVKIIKSLTWMRSLVFSPFAFPMILKSGFVPTEEELVETSPKLQYILECVKSVKEYHEATNTPMSGQVIYSNLGVEFFSKLKNYIASEKSGLGFSFSEIGIISGKHTTNVDKKSIEMNKFLAGETKLLIGSDSIQVGVDLQKNASTMYLWTFTYNPTSMKQVEGRIWRQGNRFAKTRIVYPMLENSIDPILFQYLAEKTKRIKDIWDMEGVKSQLDLRDFDPDTLKLQLVTDPKKRAEIEFIRLHDKLNSEVFFWENQKEVITKAGYINKAFVDNFPQGIELLKKLYELNYEAYENIYIEEKQQKIEKLKRDIELRKEDDSIKDAKGEKAKQKAKESKEKFIKNATKKIKETETKYSEFIEINRKDFQENIELVENKQNIPDSEYWKFLISKSNYFLQNYLNDNSIHRDLLQRDEFFEIRTNFMRLRNTLISFKVSIVDFIKLINNTLKPLNADIKDIPKLKTKIDEEIEKIQEEIKQLADKKQARIVELQKEFTENKENWKSYKDRADEFAELNHETLSDFVMPDNEPIINKFKLIKAYLNLLKKSI